ncbi:MAG: Stk1 family PASTA domain-containing Ser/Thr kinase [Candidatus Eremiobacteraeota bacterium]|nr:Stk1 family PASTA domain-containing Ser/Thr kinase [Candidatus Eremiobacteraeota bacterium]
MIEQHIFNNRYRLDNKLGEGGMATVYCGTDTVLRRRVAIKVLREQYASDDEFVRRFYQEAESAARLNHPNIVNTYDVGREGDTYYIVMELVDGPSLAEIIANDGKLPEPVAIDYAAQVASGLAYAHRTGLLHRDIKPANILVTKDDVVKLSDFGIARAVSQQTMAMTKPGMVMGSVFYLSPEQAQGHELHETSDLYSLGVVLYQMLTGDLPYKGESAVTVALKHIGDAVPTIDTAKLGISPALASIVNRLMQKHPENRFQSASEVASALREARERPSHAAFATSDDAPTQRFAAIQPPPRPSRRPDSGAYVATSMGDEEARAQRSSNTIAFALVALLLFAVVLGYALFGRNVIAPPNGVAIGNYSNMLDTQAQQSLVNSGFNPRIIRTASDTIAANHVIRQNPGAGTKLEKGAPVELFVSNGLPKVGLMDVRGYTVADATKDLQRDKFNVRVQHQFADAPKDTVIEQKPSPNSQVAKSSEIVLTISDGPKPIQLPNLSGMKLDAARRLAARLGFVINVVETAPADNIPPNTIASQDPLPGTTVPADHSTAVNVVVSSGGTAADVPGVTGQDVQSAQQQLQQAGFQPKITYAISQGSPDNGKIVDQQPQPNTPAQKGTQVQITLSVPGEIPDTEGMPLDQARATLISAGYTIGNVTPTSEGADGKVVRTEPAVGTALRPGESVNIFVNNAGGQPQR